MRARKLIHPRKVVWAMADFINEIHDLTYETLSIPHDFDFSRDNWADLLEACGAKQEYPATCKIVKSPDGMFCAMVADLGEDEFRIGYNIEDLYCKGHRQFTDNFRSRCTIAKGFADITLTLLHELGHFEAHEEFEDYDRVKSIKYILSTYPREKVNLEYFKLPDEMAATEWAIEWLQDAEHRRIAKAFEKKFFACFEKC